ncbi:hypothetical protein RIF29_00540 [Crotalaria pallida]|uniref:Uncharacterized protein n=1 Tax=Crotalaria pallida TaxID=3830 RepID=A0AAN9IW94_CROPI
MCRSNITQKWVEKKKPSREEVEKIDDCLRANDEKAVENVVAQANGESSKTSFVEESVPESSAAPKEGAKAQDKGKGILVMDASDSENAETWIPVLTRSKAQMRQGMNKGVVIKDLASKANG